ncbi:MAG: response regulator transcription factor [Bacteroidales bacterium]|nr:response regulator transcription factor [Bacteroidales bacterium]MBK8883082.1 response regulator transcription factor [Bacteroidales bacterium]
MQIKCIAIDDEPLALSKLEGFIGRIPELNLARTFDNSIEAMVWLKENQADLIFLDIQMKQLTGIQFLEATGTTSKIIITSAYDEYAIKGYDLNVTDYLLKPFSFQRFVQGVNKVMDFYSQNPGNSATTSGSDDFIFIKTEYRLERVDLGQILYIEGMKDYLRIVCIDKKIMTLQSFSKLEESLPLNKFCRVHKSYIVSIDKIKSIERNVILIAEHRIPVSNTYKESFYSRIKQ